MYKYRGFILVYNKYIHDEHKYIYIYISYLNISYIKENIANIANKANKIYIYILFALFAIFTIFSFI